MTTKEILMSKTVRDGDCLVWTKHVNKSGYGSVWHNGKNRDVHRVSYELHHGEIPDGMRILHSCDNRPCINPDHLSPGTQKQNMDDMAMRGRDKKVSGVTHHYAKLSPEIAAEIRRRYKPYCRKNSSCALAREFGVSQMSVWALLKGETWKCCQHGVASSAPCTTCEQEIEAAQA